MRVLDCTCAELISCDSNLLFNDSLLCVLGNRVQFWGFSRQVVTIFHDVMNSDTRSNIWIASSVIYAFQALILLMTIVIHCPPSVNFVLPMTFVTSTIHQPTFAPNNAPVPSLQGNLNPYL